MGVCDNQELPHWPSANVHAEITGVADLSLVSALATPGRATPDHDVDGTIERWPAPPPASEHAPLALVAWLEEVASVKYAYCSGKHFSDLVAAFASPGPRFCIAGTVRLVLPSGATISAAKALAAATRSQTVDDTPDRPALVPSSTQSHAKSDEQPAARRTGSTAGPSAERWPERTSSSAADQFAGASATRSSGDSEAAGSIASATLPDALRTQALHRATQSTSALPPRVASLRQRNAGSAPVDSTPANASREQSTQAGCVESPLLESAAPSAIGECRRRSAYRRSVSQGAWSTAAALLFDKLPARAVGSSRAPPSKAAEAKSASAYSTLMEMTAAWHRLTTRRADSGSLMSFGSTAADGSIGGDGGALTEAGSCALPPASAADRPPQLSDVLQSSVRFELSPKRAMQTHVWSDASYSPSAWPHVLDASVLWVEMPLSEAMQDISASPRLPEVCINECI